MFLLKIIDVAYTLFAYSECVILDSKNAGSETGSS